MKVVSLLSIAFALLASGTATAASLMVRPTTVVLEGSTAAATLTVSNNGDGDHGTDSRLRWDKTPTRTRWRRRQRSWRARR
jgi:P pilus assembly chaperone PapD